MGRRNSGGVEAVGPHANPGVRGVERQGQSLMDGVLFWILRFVLFAAEKQDRGDQEEGRESGEGADIEGSLGKRQVAEHGSPDQVDAVMDGVKACEGADPGRYAVDRVHGAA